LLPHPQVALIRFLSASTCSFGAERFSLTERGLGRFCGGDKVLSLSQGVRHNSLHLLTTQHHLWKKLKELWDTIYPFGQK